MKYLLILMLFICAFTLWWIEGAWDYGALSTKGFMQIALCLGLGIFFFWLASRS